jgi:PrtD family type I secretion system ABC transporter
MKTNKAQPGGATPPNPLNAAIASCRDGFVYSAVFSCVINVLMLTGPLFMMQIYDRVLTSKSVPTLVALSALVVGLYAVLGLLEFARTRVMIRIGGLVDADVRSIVFGRVLDLAIRHAPNLGSQPVRDLDQIRAFASSQAPYALFDVPWIPVYLGVTYLIHPQLALLALIGCLLLIGVAFLSEIRVKAGGTSAIKAQMHANQMLDQVIGGGETLQALGMRRSYEHMWEKSYEASVAHQRLEADRASIYSSISKVIRLILQSAVLALGGYLVIQGDLTGGAMIASTIIAARALAPVDQAIGSWRSFLAFRQSVTRLRQMLAPAAADAERMPLPQPDGRLTVEELAVLPPGGGKPILRGINFKLNSGDGLGIIGPTGSGKSTLVRTLVGVMPPAAGKVRLAGAALDQWPEDQLGRHVGYLPQEVVLFSGTVEENIARFHVPPDPQAVVRAAQKANVHDLVLSLPQGYNTRVGPDGFQMSGGQKQRVGLARALYNDPVLLVLDEPNANLDAEGEAALYKSLLDIRKSGTTLVVVAHRPSALRTVESLLYIKDGRQAAFGPKDDVLAKISPKPAERNTAKHLSVVSEQT